MESEIKVRAITVEKSHYDKLTDEQKQSMFEPENIQEAYKIFSGQCAGICYMPDNYLSKGIQNEESAIKRSGNNAKSGHYSVYEHAHITFDIVCSKAMAMVLNSTRLYSTSEKSARYTKMTPKTEIETLKYDYWMDKFSKLIKIYYPNYSDKDIEKLAMENVRYLTSVFTPTTMEFTVPYSRAILIPQWLYDISEKIYAIYNNYLSSRGVTNDSIEVYYKELADECTLIATLIDNCINEHKIIEERTLKDHKDIGISFFTNLNNIHEDVYRPTKDNNSSSSIISLFEDPVSVKEHYGDTYISSYKASFASVAQIQRHRTCPVQISLPINITKNDCYVPPIIKGTPLEDEWKRDFISLVDNGVCPQATLLKVIEKGITSDFILKCKERLCARAQLETCHVVRDQVEKFYLNKDNIYEPRTKKDIEGMVNTFATDEKVRTRCCFPGYICNEPCDRVRSNYKRNI